MFVKLQNSGNWIVHRQISVTFFIGGDFVPSLKNLKKKKKLWRATRNALPTNSELARRRVINDPICYLYSSHRVLSDYVTSLGRRFTVELQTNFKVLLTLHSFSALYWIQHAMWNCSQQLRGQFGLEETKSDSLHWVSLWIRSCRSPLCHSWSFERHNLQSR